MRVIGMYGGLGHAGKTVAPLAQALWRLRELLTMNLLVLDFETFYSSEYTLKKMTTEAYIRGAQFEALCCGLYHPGDNEQGWVPQAMIAECFGAIDWENTGVLCHHAQFDGLILSHHFGIKPAFWFDTLSMARLVVGTHVSASLASLAALFEFTPKNVPYDLFKGKHWHELSEWEQREVGEGAARDCEITYQIFQKLIAHVPRVELELIDLTIRMFTEPALSADIPALDKIAADELEKKKALLAELGMSYDDKGKPPKELSSSQQFAAILTGLGVEVEYKPSPRNPENMIPAVAKTDDFMKELLEDENEIISGLAAARLGVRSTIDETRAGRLAASARRGKLPIYLGYCTAQTNRWVGGDATNFQNFKRGGSIRNALVAGDGYKLLIADKSQIECRFLEWEANEEAALDDFRAGLDPYCGIATKFYGREITKALKNERTFGKVMRLQCGYGAGGPSIQRAAKRATPPVLITDGEGVAARDLYRSERRGVVALWKEGDEVLKFMAAPVEAETDWIRGTCRVFSHGDGSGRIVGPTGTIMHYRLEWDEKERGWKRKTRKGWVHIWGGVVVQNITEMLSRCDLGANLVTIKETFPALKLLWVTHDEAVYLVKDDENAPHYLEHVLAIMRTSPEWASDIPLDAEGHLSDRYDK